MRITLPSRLETGACIVLDGALATELERRGASLDGPLWSGHILAREPQRIRAVHLEYFRAGAEVAISASYQTSWQGLRDQGYSMDEARDLVRRSVHLASEARERFCAEIENEALRYIAGSVGCYGAYLADGSEYRGRYGRTVRDLVEFHRPRIEWLIEAGADILACETIPCESEAEALASLLGEYAHTPAWISFSCRDGARVWEGQSIEGCAEAVRDVPNVVALGVNCTSPGFVPELLDRLRSRTRKPLLAYPNSGETWEPARRTYANDRACDDFGAAALRWRDHGARLIGGCCRTTPDDIRAIATALHAARPDTTERET